MFQKFLSYTLHSSHRIYGNDTFMAPCKPWTESEPCEKDILNLVSLTSLEDDHILHKQLYLLQDDCVDGEMKIAFLDDNGEYVHLSYNDQVNSSVTVGDDNECFILKHQLCGPDSITFQSNGDTLLILTACNGAVTMKQPFDFCGYVFFI